MQEINSREIGVSDKLVLTIGTIHAGNAGNAIPDMATIGGTIRTYDEDTRTFVKNRMLEISKNIASAFRASAEVVFGSGCPTLLNDEELSKSAEKYSKELLGEEMAFTVEELLKMSNNQSSKSAGSEDFAYVSHKVPSIMLTVAAGQPEKGYSYPQHHPKVKFDEDALPFGSTIYAYIAIRWLMEH